MPADLFCDMYSWLDEAGNSKSKAGQAHGNSLYTFSQG
jgi:hypothetical protein